MSVNPVYCMDGSVQVINTESRFKLKTEPRLTGGLALCMLSQRRLDHVLPKDTSCRSVALQQLPALTLGRYPSLTIEAMGDVSVRRVKILVLPVYYLALDPRLTNVELELSLYSQ